MTYSRQFLTVVLPFSGLTLLIYVVNEVSAAETVQGGWFPSQVKPKTSKVVFTAFLLGFQHRKQSVKFHHLVCMIEQWAGGSSTRKTKDTFAVCKVRATFKKTANKITLLSLTNLVTFLASKFSVKYLSFK